MRKSRYRPADALTGSEKGGMPSATRLSGVVADSTRNAHDKACATIVRKSHRFMGRRLRQTSRLRPDFTPIAILALSRRKCLRFHDNAADDLSLEREASGHGFRDGRPQRDRLGRVSSLVLLLIKQIAGLCLVRR